MSDFEIQGDEFVLKPRKTCPKCKKTKITVNRTQGDGVFGTPAGIPFHSCKSCGWTNREEIVMAYLEADAAAYQKRRVSKKRFIRLS